MIHAARRASFVLLGAIFFLGFAQNLPAASPLLHYHSRVWQTDDGLPQNSVQAILQARDGYLWIGTQRGLARFDGVKFVTFDRRNVPQLADDWIEALCETDDGTLWIGTHEGHLLQFRNGEFSELKQEVGWPGLPVMTIFQAHDRSLWLGLRDGVIRFAGRKFQIIRGDENFQRSSVRSISEDAHHNLWFATTAGLFCLKGGVDQIPYRATKVSEKTFVRRVMCDRSGALWVGAARAGLTRVQDGAITTFIKRDGLADMNVSAIYEDRRGNIWIGTFNGLNRFVDGKILTEVDEAGSAYDTVSAFCEDFEGNLWIGAKDGLYRLTPKMFHTYNTYTTLHVMQHKNFMSVLEDKQGSIWFGTWGGGLHQLKDGNIRTYSASPNTGLMSDLVLAIHDGSDGAIWIGGDFDAGIYRLENDRFKRFGRAHGLDGRGVKVIREDKRHNIWVGSIGAVNVFSGGKFSRYSVSDGSVSASVREILEDRSGVIWIATDHGLSTFQDGKLHPFERSNLSHLNIAALYEDAEGILWVGTIEGGLFRISNNAITRFSVNDGMFDDSAHEIIEDDFGNLWMTCRNGVYRASKKDLNAFAAGKIKSIACISYGRADGMLSTECNSVAKPASWKGRDGKLWFATSKGLAVTDPRAHIDKNEVVPPIRIERIVFDGRSYDVEGKDRIEFSPGRGQLEIQYTALSFRAPEKNRFKFRLEGSDTGWMDPGTRRVAYYNNLNPGNYTFRVRGSNNDGVWNEDGAVLAVVLKPYLWQTWWFKTAVVSLAIVTAFYAIKIRRDRIAELERLRLRIAADLHDELGSNLASIALLSQMEEKSGDAAKNDLTEIHRIALGTANSIREIVWFINPDYDSFADMISRMKEVASTMLVGTKYQFVTPTTPSSRRLSLDFRRNIFLIFKEILHNIAKHSRATHVEIEVREERGEFWMRITDNGVGFDEQSTRRGNGLKNLKLRMAQLGGTIQIDSEPRKGTSICVVVSIT